MRNSFVSSTSGHVELVLAAYGATAIVGCGLYAFLYDLATRRAPFRRRGGFSAATSTKLRTPFQDAWVRAGFDVGPMARESEAFGAWLPVRSPPATLPRSTCCAGSDASPSKRRSSFRRWNRPASRSISKRPSQRWHTGYPYAVLVLHDVEGFTHEEIAEQLGITAGTSKGQLFKARRAVRARLLDQYRGEDAR